MKRPPHRALRFLRWFCKEDYLEEVEGDVLEIYDEQCKTSPRKARWGLLWNVLRHFHPVFMKKPTTPWNITSLGMLHNYFKVAWRSAQKQWLYATINLGGLALGLTCFILVLIYLKHENSYDRFLQNSSQVYRVYQKQLGNEHMGTDLFAVTPYRLAPAMTAEYPEVVQATSVREENALLAQDGKSFLESGYMADSHFF
ncbi:MAG: permease prefix domain 2-containing transporter, partial [Bacteroidota bacterium]